jgi:hypothetical protein
MDKIISNYKSNVISKIRVLFLSAQADVELLFCCKSSVLVFIVEVILHVLGGNEENSNTSQDSRFLVEIRTKYLQDTSQMLYSSTVLALYL